MEPQENANVADEAKHTYRATKIMLAIIAVIFIWSWWPIV